MKLGFINMLRIGFVGVPGCGKTSTARGLAAFCRGHEKLRKIELTAEYARRFISKYGDIDRVSDQYRIMQKQVEWEDIVPKEETDVIITDSPVFLGFLYALDLREIGNKKDVMYINDIFKALNKLNCPQRYDIIFHLCPILKPLKDGVRPELHFDEKWRDEADNKIQSIFKMLFPPKHFITLESISFEDRVNECIEHVLKIL